MKERPCCSPAGSAEGKGEQQHKDSFFARRLPAGDGCSWKRARMLPPFLCSPPGEQQRGAKSGFLRRGGAAAAPVLCQAPGCGSPPASASPHRGTGFAAGEEPSTAKRIQRSDRGALLRHLQAELSAKRGCEVVGSAWAARAAGLILSLPQRQLREMRAGSAERGVGGTLMGAGNGGCTAVGMKGGAL